MIIVDGVLTSCYAGTHHDLGNLMATPMQRFPAVIEWIFGDDAGLPAYVTTARQLSKMLLPEGQFSTY